MTVSPKGYCGDHCDILEWGGALRGGVFTDPGATSGGQVPLPPLLLSLHDHLLTLVLLLVFVLAALRLRLLCCSCFLAFLSCLFSACASACASTCPCASACAGSNRLPGGSARRWAWWAWRRRRSSSSAAWLWRLPRPARPSTRPRSEPALVRTSLSLVRLESFSDLPVLG